MWGNSGYSNCESSWIVETISLVVDDRLSVLLRLHTVRPLFPPLHDCLLSSSASLRPESPVFLPTLPRLFALFFARLPASRLPPALAWS